MYVHPQKHVWKIQPRPHNLGNKKLYKQYSLEVYTKCTLDWNGIQTWFKFSVHFPCNDSKTHFTTFSEVLLRAPSHNFTVGMSLGMVTQSPITVIWEIFISWVPRTTKFGHSESRYYIKHAPELRNLNTLNNKHANYVDTKTVLRDLSLKSTDNVHLLRSSTRRCARSSNVKLRNNCTN